MPGPTQIEPEKIRAYLATGYRLRDGETDIVLEIGRRSDEVAALLQSRGVNCGAFITAYNPRGTMQSQSANAPVQVREFKGAPRKLTSRPPTAGPRHLGGSGKPPNEERCSGLFLR